MKNKPYKLLIQKLILVFISLILSSCGENDPVMQDIKNNGKLIVLTRNSPTTYFLNTDNLPTGFEYDLTKKLAESMNVDIEYKLYDTNDELMDALNTGEGHIVAAGLTATEERKQNKLFSSSYKSVQQQVVCHRKSKLPKFTADLINKSLLIITESSYQETLVELNKQHPELKWISTNKLSTEQILKKVANKEIDCTIADSNIIASNHRYYPNLMVAFDISETQELAWLIPDESEHFKRFLDNWFDTIKNNSTLNIINERYYGYAESFDYYNNHIFLKRIKTRLPKYKTHFQKVGKKYQIPWELLAAQSYQESGWNAKARSPTGVRGLMMLTQNTAKAMGVKKRINPIQSIQGGAKYLDHMLKKIPDDVNPSDKIWFALAAYNIGFGHLLDARQLARQQEKDPGTWHDIKEVFPLLSQKKHYKKLKYGYARGLEPVKYIDRIRYYQDVLINTLK